MITTEQDRQERRKRRRDDDGRELRRLGRTDLLGLHRDFDYWNPPRDPQPATAAHETGPAVVADDRSDHGVGDTAEGAKG